MPKLSGYATILRSKEIAKVVTKKTLLELYCNKKMSQTEITKHLGISSQAIISYYMKKYSIPTRTLSESAKLWFDKTGRKPHTRWVRLRLRTLEKCGGIKCVNCGCTDYRVLEINHKNGGRRFEQMHLYKGSHFYQAIVSGKRKTDDLDVRCKLCNILYLLGQRHRINDFEVIWKGA